MMSQKQQSTAAGWEDPPPQYTSSPQQWAQLKPLARTMRHLPTQAEAVVWERLRQRRLAGYKFRRQHAISGFIVDFVCIETRLIIEIDGSVHDQPDRQAYDAERQTHLETAGFRVLRFTNDEVMADTDAVVRTIIVALTTPSP